MALTTDLVQPTSIHRVLQHVGSSITDGTLTALISGQTGKRIRIWRFHSYCAGSNKTCELFSGTDSFIVINTTKSVVHEFASSDGVPVFTCNAGDAFKADPNDSTNWYFYIVYRIE